MPFRPERYPTNWPAIRASIRARAEEQCECIGECGDVHEGGRCLAPNGELILRDPHAPAQWTEHDPALAGRNHSATKVVLTVAHLDHDEQNNDPSNLRTLCQRCHLALDRADNARRAREGRAAPRAVGMLPGLDGGDRG